jgi:hypothetical protein
MPARRAHPDRLGLVHPMPPTEPTGEIPQREEMTESVTPARPRACACRG